MEPLKVNSISIQVSLSGYSFTVNSEGKTFSSPWLGADKIFTTPEFQKRYDEVDISLLTPKFVLVPEQFFSEERARSLLSETVSLSERDVVSYVRIPESASVLLFSPTIGESLSKVISQTVLTTSGESAPVLPEMYYMLRTMDSLPQYNKILASYMDGHLYLAIAEGRTLRLSNVYEAPDFTTAEYFIFLALSSLQLNPEVSVVSFRTPLSPDEEMSLYRYFSSVEVLCA
ncbi:MAG: DUF3822 family protein [Bacteroidales bacterium]|nr:DUF3822 family protein [Bacteroidales bacterium]